MVNEYEGYKAVISYGMLRQCLECFFFGEGVIGILEKAVFVFRSTTHKGFSPESRVKL